MGAAAGIETRSRDGIVTMGSAGAEAGASSTTGTGASVAGAAASAATGASTTSAGASTLSTPKSEHEPQYIQRIIKTDSRVQTTYRFQTFVISEGRFLS